MGFFDSIDDFLTGVSIALSLPKFKMHLGNVLTQGVIFGWFCVEPGVGLNDPYESLPTQDILR